MRTAFIHTSDRIAYKRCRRNWNWASPLRQNLTAKEKVLPLWFGTGWHFVMEDFHGENVYGNPVSAWKDFVNATFNYYGEEYMPRDWRDSVILGQGMVENYLLWLKGREGGYKTFVYEGVPQTEVRFRIPIPISPELLYRAGFDRCFYQGTIDRVVEDQFGSLWIVEYKTANQIFQMHYLTDPQITAYCWAAQMLYGRPIAGCIYMQWRKDVPEEPRILKNGTLSVADNQKTTGRQYQEAMKKLYGNDFLTKGYGPKANVDFLNTLNAQESEDHDAFVRRDRISRNQHSLEAEGTKILMEVEDMLNLDQSLYPAPDRLCHWCQFQEPCIDLDDGSDWEDVINSNYEQSTHAQGIDQWRSLLKHPRLLTEVQPPPDRKWLSSQLAQ